jgi:hypothetical protein
MKKAKISALDLTVYYNPQYRACANGGITERFDRLLLVGTCTVTDFKPFTRGYIDLEYDPLNTADNGLPENAVVLRCRTNGNRRLFDLVPFSKYHDGKWYMFGGSYASTSDSRLGEAIRKMGGDFYGALAVHDRTEG